MRVRVSVFCSPPSPHPPCLPLVPSACRTRHRAPVAVVCAVVLPSSSGCVGSGRLALCVCVLRVVVRLASFHSPLFSVWASFLRLSSSSFPSSASDSEESDGGCSLSRFAYKGGLRSTGVFAAMPRCSAAAIGTLATAASRWSRPAWPTRQSSRVCSRARRLRPHVLALPQSLGEASLARAQDGWRCGRPATATSSSSTQAPRLLHPLRQRVSSIVIVFWGFRSASNFPTMCALNTSPSPPEASVRKHDCGPSGQGSGTWARGAKFRRIRPPRARTCTKGGATGAL